MLEFYDIDDVEGIHVSFVVTQTMRTNNTMLSEKYRTNYAIFNRKNIYAQFIHIIHSISG